jgi:hypothetical protein
LVLIGNCLFDDKYHCEMCLNLKARFGDDKTLIQWVNPYTLLLFPEDDYEVQLFVYNGIKGTAMTHLKCLEILHSPKPAHNSLWSVPASHLLKTSVPAPLNIERISVGRRVGVRGKQVWKACHAASV